MSVASSIYLEIKHTQQNVILFTTKNVLIQKKYFLKKEIFSCHIILFFLQHEFFSYRTICLTLRKFYIGVSQFNYKQC